MYPLKQVILRLFLHESHQINIFILLIHACLFLNVLAEHSHNLDSKELKET